MKPRLFYLDLIQRLSVQGTCTVYTDPATGEKGYAPFPGALCQELSGRPEVHLLGGGHVSAALAALLHTLSWRVSVQDDRPEFVTEQRFPHARRLCASFDSLPLCPDGDYAVIMTRGHQDDYVCLRQLLRRRCGYLGMIGSRSKVAATAQRLQEDGFTPEEIGSIHSPVGLRIGAQTPEEIAVSIAAEIIQVFRSSPKDYLERSILDALTAQSGPLVMATVLEKTGSSPRGAGARMLVGPDGSITGTIGGGAVEAAAIREAAALCGGARPQIRTYDLSNDAAATIGMICGGSIRVLFEPLEL
ncbi:XdhC family protein [Oscillibacter sp. MSJ-2]|uniref:XdhC family protein n=1 Tax=Dysosmobacter acutus TaxID=2841504 RepID=A0ABS6FB34_9FIRM|nr:XdhC family protein [Dysosmobacter acutus]MBU5627503.1 XdhC family protein [Dysosmobacter acutus]